MSKENQITNYIINYLVNKLDNIIVEGLKLKGFKFKNKNELETFIKTRCRRTDNIKLKEHIYYVDNIPFLLHNYEVIYEPITVEDKEIKINANFGKYSFL